MLIRSAQSYDIPVIREIDISAAQKFRETALLRWIADAQPMPAEKLLTFMQEGNIWLAEIDNKSVGFIILKPYADELFIHELSVRYCYHQQGIGSALLKHAYDDAFKQGYQALTLTTFCHIAWNEPFIGSEGLLG